MVNVLGPNVRGAAIRPARPVDQAGNLWFQDCTGGDPLTGTALEQGWFNDIIANFRTMIGATPVSTALYTDNLITNALRSGGLIHKTLGGTANAWTADFTPDIPAYSAGLMLNLITTAANTGAVTLNVDGLGVKDVRKNDGSALASGDIPNGALIQVIYNGVEFRVMKSVASDIAAAKSPFNVAQQVFNARVTLSGVGMVTYQTGSYTKKSATSQLVVETSTNLFATGTAAGFGRISGLPTNFEFTCKNADSGTSSAACTGRKIYAGMAAGVVSWTWAFGRNDGLSWTSIINPRTVDAGYMPAETTSFIQFSELEP